MEQLIVMIIFGIFFGIWKVIENAGNVPAGKPPVGNNRPQRETSRQKLQSELDKFLREVNSENPSPEQKQKQEENARKDNRNQPAYETNVFPSEKPKPRQEPNRESKRNKQKPKQEIKPVATYQDVNKPHESKIKNRLPASKLSTVESHVQSYMGNKLDSNITETTNVHLKPFETHISGEAAKGVASKYDDYGSSTPPQKAAPIINPSQLYQLMNDQNSVRNAFILSEILKRPDFTRFKKPTTNQS